MAILIPWRRCYRVALYLGLLSKELFIAFKIIFQFLVIVYLIRIFNETGTQSRFSAGLIQVHG